MHLLLLGGTLSTLTGQSCWSICDKKHKGTCGQAQPHARVHADSPSCVCHTPISTRVQRMPVNTHVCTRKHMCTCEPHLAPISQFCTHTPCFTHHAHTGTHVLTMPVRTHACTWKHVYTCAASWSTISQSNACFLTRCYFLKTESEISITRGVKPR